MAGKRAAMVMPLQSARNREILDRLAQFIGCVFQIKVDATEKIKDVELETDIKIQNVRDTLDSNLAWMEKLFSKDMIYLNDEKNVTNVFRKMEKAIDSLNQMDTGSLCSSNIFSKRRRLHF